jgi:hypothetical protein
MRLDKMPLDLSAVHFCPVCCTAYTSHAEAAKCAASKVAPPFAVGDIVVETSPRWHWHDGPDHWVRSYGNPKGSADKRGQRVDSRGEREFYWVVTAVGDYADVHRRRPFEGYASDHKPVYWVQTLGLLGKPYGGWTSHGSHHEFKLAKRPPPRVIAESRPMIGYRENNLL